MKVCFGNKSDIPLLTMAMYTHENRFFGHNANLLEI